MFSENSSSMGACCNRITSGTKASRTNNKLIGQAIMDFHVGNLYHIIPDCRIRRLTSCKR